MESTIHGTEPATRSVASSAGWGRAASAQLLAFFWQLRRIPIGAWCSLAEADPHITAARVHERPSPASDGVHEVQADRVARARLREVMEGMPTVVRRIRSRIDDEIGIVAGIASPVMVGPMRRAARLAACALAARPWLSPEEFVRLYRPFAELIQIRTLDPQ